MTLTMTPISQLINNRDYTGLAKALSVNPVLANQDLPYDDSNTTKAHPLHRICDGVFSGKYTDEEAVDMAKIFLAHGAHINGNEMSEKKDTPLIAAASLSADKVALYYIENGADIHHRGTHGGTALHWAAWCGRDAVVKKLVEKGALINQTCIDFQATPLFWAILAFKRGDIGPVTSYATCAGILVGAGADATIPNSLGKTVYDLLTEEDRELKELLIAR